MTTSKEKLIYIQGQLKDPCYLLERRTPETLFLYHIKNKRVTALQSVAIEIYDEVSNGLSYEEIILKLFKNFSEVKQSQIQKDFDEFIDELYLNFDFGKSVFANNPLDIEDNFGYELLCDEYARHHYPLNVSIDITGNCNCNCIHCYLPRSSHRWSLSQFKNFLNDLYEQKGFFLTLTGGEIFLNEDLCIKMIELAIEKKFAVTLLTNGTLLSNDLCYQLAKWSLDTVNISFYGNSSKIHDGITKVHGSYQKSLNNFEKLMSLGVNVWGRYVLLKQNEIDFTNFCNDWSKSGKRYNVTYQIHKDFEGKKELNDLRVSEDKINEFIGMKLIRPLSFNLCTAGISKCRVGSDGSLYPCEILPVAKGNVHQEGFSNLWQKYKGLKLPQKKGCPGISYLENNSFNLEAFL